MPTFRFHCGGYKESMDICVIVNSIEELEEVISKTNRITNKFTTNEDKFVITSSFCPTNEKLIIKEYCFDDRNGWNTHIVLRKSNCVTSDAYVIGFLSDNFCKDKL
jgi:hypothetical protein